MSRLPPAHQDSRGEIKATTSTTGSWSRPQRPFSCRLDSQLPLSCCFTGVHDSLPVCVCVCVRMRAGAWHGRKEGNEIRKRMVLTMDCGRPECQTRDSRLYSVKDIQILHPHPCPSQKTRASPAQTAGPKVGKPKGGGRAGKT